MDPPDQRPTTITRRVGRGILLVVAICLVGLAVFVAFGGIVGPPTYPSLATGLAIGG